MAEEHAVNLREHLAEDGEEDENLLSVIEAKMRNTARKLGPGMRVKFRVLERYDDALASELEKQCQTLALAGAQHTDSSVTDWREVARSLHRHCDEEEAKQPVQFRDVGESVVGFPTVPERIEYVD